MRIVKYLLWAAALSSLFGCAAQKQINPAPAALDDDKRLECSAYYLLLTMKGDQPDISKDQLGKAFYALLHQVGDTPESRAVEVKKLSSLRAEIPGGITAENIVVFRQKHDAECKELLKSAWCDTYEKLSPSACVK